MSLRLVFMGTPDFAVTALSEMIGAGHEVLAVYTQPARPAKRGMALTPSPVEALARTLGLEVRTPLSLKLPEEQAYLKELAPDVIVVVAYGLLLPQAVLDIPPLGCLNLHASLLPRWRGAAPIQRAVMAGDAQTGVMVMRMEAGLDTGPVAMVERIALSDTMNAGDVHDVLARLGADLLHRAVGALERGGLTFSPQSLDGVCYAHKIDKSEGRIDWSRPASHIHHQIRGLAPAPCAWFMWKNERIKVLKAALVDAQGTAGCLLDDELTIACGQGTLRLLSVQKAGKAAMDAKTFLRGTPILKGMQLQSDPEGDGANHT